MDTPYLEFAVDISKHSYLTFRKSYDVQILIHRTTIRLAKFFARVRILSFTPLDVQQSHLSHKRMIRLCRDHGDELNDTRKSVIWCHSHSAIVANAALNFLNLKPL